MKREGQRISGTAVKIFFASGQGYDILFERVFSADGDRKGPG